MIGKIVRSRGNQKIATEFFAKKSFKWNKMIKRWVMLFEFRRKLIEFIQDNDLIFIIGSELKTINVSRTHFNTVLPVRGITEGNLVLFVPDDPEIGLWIMWLDLTWWKTWENSAKFRPFRFEFHNRVSKNKQLWLNKQARHNSGTFRNVENWTEQTKMKSSNIFKVNIQK